MMRPLNSPVGAALVCARVFMPIMLWCCLMISVSLWVCPPGSAEESSKLVAAVRAYFEAEISGDISKVWAMLAPSSAFKKAYSFTFYEEMQRRSEVTVKAYQIEDVTEISENDDRVKLPDVEKIAKVRVEVILSDKTGRDFHHRTVLTFMRERGVWYKG